MNARGCAETRRRSTESWSRMLVMRAGVKRRELYRMRSAMWGASDERVEGCTWACECDCGGSWSGWRETKTVRSEVRLVDRMNVP